MNLLGLNNPNENLPARLRLIRTARGASLDQVGEWIGTSRQFVHQIEVGARPAPPEIIEKLSAAFGVKASFFEKPINNIIDNGSVNFRHRASTPDYIKHTITSKASIVMDMISLLDEYFSLPEPSIPTYDYKTSEDIEIAAESTRRDLGVPLHAPISNMVRLVEGAGAITCTFSNHDEKVDALSTFSKRPLIVLLKKNIRTACRTRFDIAHELGHLVLHRGLETGTIDFERDADRFASAFLLPRTQFASEFKHSGNINWQRIYGLKIRWKVSAAAIVRRAYDLGIFSNFDYKKAMTYLSKTGQRKSERFDESIAEETPELLKTCLAELERDQSSLSEFLMRLEIPPQTVAEIFDATLPERYVFSRAND